MSAKPPPPREINNEYLQRLKKERGYGTNLTRRNHRGYRYGKIIPERSNDDTVKNISGDITSLRANGVGVNDPLGKGIIDVVTSTGSAVKGTAKRVATRRSKGAAKNIRGKFFSELPKNSISAIKQGADTINKSGITVTKSFIDSRKKIKEGIKKGAVVTGTAIKKGAVVTGTAIKKGADTINKSGITVTKSFIDSRKKIKEGINQGAVVTGTAIKKGAVVTGTAIIRGADYTGTAIIRGADYTGTAIKKGVKKTKDISINTADMLYNYIPTLLELDDVKCCEFAEKFKILIEGLLTDIRNINNEDLSITMLYDENIHIKNANEVLRAMIACFHCIIKQINEINEINDKDNDYDCNKSQQKNIEASIEPLDSLKILRETFQINPDTQATTISST